MRQGHATRRTGRLVRLQDRAAGVVVTVGGLSVLAAMLSICAFLVISVTPLFRGGSAERDPRAVGEAPGGALAARVNVDAGVFWLLGDDGVVRACGPDGSVWGEAALVEQGGVRVRASEVAGREVLAGLDDGRLVRCEAWTRAVPLLEEDLPAGLSPGPGLTPVDGAAAAELARGARLERADARSLAITREGDALRLWDFGVVRHEPMAIEAGGAPIVAVSGQQISTRERVDVAVLGDGGVRVVTTRSTARLGGGATQRSSVREARAAHPDGAGAPRWAFLLEDASTLVTVWEDGAARRYALGEGLEPVESFRVTAPGVRTTAAARALGGRSLLVGDDGGSVHAWTGGAGEGGSVRMLRSSSRRVGEAAVTSIGIGDRDRTIAIGLADGSVVLENVSSGKVVASWTGDGRPVSVSAVAPALDRVVAIGDGGAVRSWALEPGHPEATWKSLFGRVQYEGYAGPRWVYQSTGSPGSEPKLSLVPLIWGTVKATVVAMAFAVPVAVLAAVYTSEFLHRSYRRMVKPTIELMASLPSVVLGYVAAMVVAPYLREWLPAVIVGLGVVPVTVLVSAAAWRAVPAGVARRVPTGALTLLVLASLVMGVAVSGVAGPAVESWLFAQEGGPSDLRGWLDSGQGPAWPGWAMALTPLGMIAAALGWRAGLSRRLEAVWNRMAPTPAALAQAGLMLVQVAMGLGAAGVAGAALDAAGLDPRDSIFGPFSQRNTLVVGLIMGVAVIPIIYTISEDALHAVPRSLRFASLGCGATAWQTAVRVVLPVAGSGIFSACMVGLGRAVGETMIVLMATGNTPEINLNLFSGIRTLAANIAVELPEAPRGGTHYHLLFLCGLVLFAMTLAINTTAEVVRQRFRKRNAAL